MKMWILTFALLTVYGVISGATDICEKSARDICFTTNVEPVGFPDSIEALDKICPMITNKLSCLVDYKSQCGLEHPGTIDEIVEKVYEFTSDACNKDSEMHRELSIRLPCLGRVVKSYSNSCRPIIEDVSEAVRSRILGDDESTDEDHEYNHEEWRKHFCMSEALDYACFVAYTSVTCGDAAKETVKRIVEPMGYLDTVCHADIREEVKEMISVMQVEMEEGLEIKNFISKA